MKNNDFYRKNTSCHLFTGHHAIKKGYPISNLKPWSPTCDQRAWQAVMTRTQLKMILSPNDEAVASSKKHTLCTQFKTRVHKPYPISDQKGRNWYPIFKPTWLKYHTLLRRTYLYSLYKGVPPLGKKRVADYESSL